ncbi:NADH-quinone oxidoreductase subunit NuoG [Thauera chlorobenzoica]|uniref:NADH-quinone oxidoreductase n=1 Tax=Thauera chlorobenzoica TaxID=96773 RepID=A0A1H5VKR4_9RHOO|nr:NADH-quinone oxidoreductase subunit NuoG [Thauera chlorobenzoica]APR05741.1 NADH-ubiquinone oxidoreductase chain G [Thauera chlorobenzoica]SEF87859.1 NADH dehydrogenase subunit G [Thauera chlorobenzoica]
MLEIEIDGKQVQVNDGSTVMDAAVVAGAYIPHFCYHKKLSIAASCRMCLVQVEKAPKPLPACATPVTNGMKVWTHSEQAVKAQKGVMEFLLINHPLDCPICDQGGECQLQDLAVGYGSSASRYQEEKRVVFNKNLGALVSTDMTRCINCTRCVRFTTEIAGEMEMGQAFRGEHAEIMPFIERTIDTELSGNIIDLCPVGALTSKPFRFAARTWELSRRKSVSPHDALGANLIVQTKHDTVKRVLPLENEELNECWLSDKDRFSYEALASEQRLTTPMIKQGGQWKAVDWQVALEFAATGLRGIAKDHGAAALGALASPHSTVEELYLLQKLMRGLGSENVDFRLRQADFRADGKRAGAPWLGMPVAGVADLNRLLVIGSFLRKDAPLLAQRVRQAAKKGLHVSAVGPNAEEWLIPVRNRALVAPSAMVATLAQVVVALAREKGAEVSPALLGKLPDTVADEALAIAQSLASGRKVAVWLGSLAAHHGRASELQMLAQEIARLTAGSFGFIGEAANSVGGYLAGAVPGADGLDAAAMIEQPRKAYVVLGAEPDLDFANPAATMAAMSSAQLVVGLSAFDSPALRAVADVLLPIAPFSETSGTFVNCEGRAQSFTAVARPLGDVRPGWKVLRVLGNLLSLEGFGYDDSEAVRAQALPADLAAALDNGIEGVVVSSASAAANALERVADVPIYFADALVRRAPSLQKTRDAAAPVARIAPATLAALGLAAGQKIRVVQGGGGAELTVQADAGLAAGCVRVAAAHSSTAALGAMSGELSVERV